MTLQSFILVSVFILMAACQAEPPIDLPKQGRLAPTSTPSRVGQPLKGSQAAVYRLMEDGRLRHIHDWATYLALGYQPDDLVQVSDQELVSHRLDLPLTRWVAGDQSALYFLKEGQTYRVPDTETMVAMGGTLTEVTLVPAEFFDRFKPAPHPLPPATLSNDDQAHPGPTAALWANNFLWTANETGLLTRWDVQAGAYQEYRLPGQPRIQTLLGDGQMIYAGTNTGGVWEIQSDAPPRQRVAEASGWVSALAIDPHHGLWYADVNHFDGIAGRYHLGRGLVKVGSNAKEQVYHLDGDNTAYDPLKNITALAYQTEPATLWIATRFAGLLQFHFNGEQWQQYTTFNSGLLDNAIADLKLALDGTLWLATPSGVSSYQNGTWKNDRLAEGLTETGALSLVITSQGTVWVGGDSYLAQKEKNEPWQVYTALEYPLLTDQFKFAVLDNQEQPWFIGRRYKVHFDGQTWTAYDTDVRRSVQFTSEPSTTAAPPPLDFPSPRENYQGWLQTWPRPEHDNGRGLHFLQTHWFDEFETHKQIERMKLLGVQWTLVNYANHYQLIRVAPLFKQAGIMVIWRPFVRPYEPYPNWTEDVKFLRAQGIPPYIQLYNEPGLAQEWDEAHPPDPELFLSHLLPAIRQVYDAGGYVGLQFLDPDELRLTLQQMKAYGLTDVFDRLFFVAHPYGLNHPPEYDEDVNSVLGFQEFATVFEEEIGFVPVIIAGEGGWRPGERQDNRYPAVSEQSHRDYHRAVFDWFRTGQLSNGDPLPDYFFAFCPWLISDPIDPAAWFDSRSGDRTLTIEAIKAMPPFEREFSWDR